LEIARLDSQKTPALSAAFAHWASQREATGHSSPWNFALALSVPELSETKVLALLIIQTIFSISPRKCYRKAIQMGRQNVSSVWAYQSATCGHPCTQAGGGRHPGPNCAAVEELLHNHEPNDAGGSGPMRQWPARRLFHVLRNSWRRARGGIFRFVATT